MTNGEWLRSLNDEELSRSIYFCDCVKGTITRTKMRESGEPCLRDKIMFDKDTNLADFIFSGMSGELCAKCKTEWLKSEYKCEVQE